MSTLQSRIEQSSIPEPNSGCWLWLLSLGTNGYGQLGIAGRTVAAHRASYAAYIGPIPDGLFVLHRCDNPACVNPAHLWLGTNSDNILDSIAKGRTRPPVGVTYVARNKAWQAQIGIDGRNVYLGKFRQLADALKAYQSAREARAA